MGVWLLAKQVFSVRVDRRSLYGSTVLSISLKDAPENWNQGESHPTSLHPTSEGEVEMHCLPKLKVVR